MQDLEYLGLLDSPHISAGRIPTQMGLRMFVDSLLEVGTVADEDRERIDATAGTNDQDVTALLDHIGTALSGITRGASLVLAPKVEAISSSRIRPVMRETRVKPETMEADLNNDTLWSVARP